MEWLTVSEIQVGPINDEVAEYFDPDDLMLRNHFLPSFTPCSPGFDYSFKPKAGVTCTLEHEEFQDDKTTRSLLGVCQLRIKPSSGPEILFAEELVADSRSEESSGEVIFTCYDEAFRWIFICSGILIGFLRVMNDTSTEQP